MSADAEVRNVVKSFILKEFLPGVPESELTDTTPLISGGILDSLATVRLVAMLEDRYKVEIEAHEASISHFNAVADIAALVQSKRRT